MRLFVESARRKRSAVVVGLDPDPALMPASGLPEAEAVYEFCRDILEAVEGVVAAVKPQVAYFERLGPPGMQVYADLIRDARELGLPVISDAKRGDIGSTVRAYAEAHLRVYGADAVTVNPYMGSDAVLPFLEEARRLGRGGGAFVLVATSNRSAEEIQAAGDPPVRERAARLVAELGDAAPGERDVGAVVGVTRPEVGRRVRELLPEALFLAPGYGTQGGGARDVLSLLDERGGGVLVNSSRGILYAYRERGGDFRVAAREAARQMRDALREAGVEP
jgi:orotidine-5'-phosphate decarboxylase